MGVRGAENSFQWGKNFLTACPEMPGGPPGEVGSSLSLERAGQTWRPLGVRDKEGTQALEDGRMEGLEDGRFYLRFCCSSGRRVKNTFGGTFTAESDVSLFWGLEVQDRGVGRNGFSSDLPPRLSVSLPLAACSRGLFSGPAQPQCLSLLRDTSRIGWETILRT